MKPFLILQLRPIDEVADNEFEAFLKYGQLERSEVHRIRMEKAPFEAGLDLDQFSGVIVGGGPSNVSDPSERKSDIQKRFEAELQNIYPKIEASDFPFFGACYGLGSWVQLRGGQVSQARYAEKIGAVDIRLQAGAEQDPLLRQVPPHFKAFVGHKEACQSLPPHAQLLASSPTCPIQMIRVKQNIYATQFHPELDAPSLALRIRAYREYGYFAPEKADELIQASAHIEAKTPQKILKAFIDRYRS